MSHKLLKQYGIKIDTAFKYHGDAIAIEQQHRIKSSKIYSCMYIRIYQSTWYFNTILMEFQRCRGKKGLVIEVCWDNY